MTLIIEYGLNQENVHGYKGILSFNDFKFTWSEIESGYVRNSSDWIVFSTGASTRNMQKNIYDLAGNVHEYTLENYNNIAGSQRGSMGSTKDFCVSNRHQGLSIDLSTKWTGFRVSIY